VSNRNIGHGHVWERPDGMRARCGGPAVCAECSSDAMRLKEAALFTDPIDVAILLRWKDRWQSEAQDLRKQEAAK
jgi:hypothetical protein